MVKGMYEAWVPRGSSRLYKQAVKYGRLYEPIVKTNGPLMGEKDKDAFAKAIDTILSIFDVGIADQDIPMVVEMMGTLLLTVNTNWKPLINRSIEQGVLRNKRPPTSEQQPEEAA